MAIALEQVSKTYGPVRALRGVSLELPVGDVTAVTGANGSGKSTLLAVVGTLAKPTSGRVRHGSLGATRQEVRRTLGWLGHDALCYPDLTGRENVELAARLHGLDPDAAFASASERFSMVGFADRPFRTYSRGQRQRTALARALVHQPMLVLLDEPTTGLDRDGVRRLAMVVAEEAKRGACVVVVTHDEAFASEVASRQVRLERGRVAP